MCECVCAHNSHEYICVYRKDIRDELYGAFKWTHILLTEYKDLNKMEYFLRGKTEFAKKA